MKLSGEVKIQWSDEDGKSSIYHTYPMKNHRKREIHNITRTIFNFKRFVCVNLSNSIEIQCVVIEYAPHRMWEIYCSILLCSKVICCSNTNKFFSYFRIFCYDWAQFTLAHASNCFSLWLQPECHISTLSLILLIRSLTIAKVYIHSEW